MKTSKTLASILLFFMVTMLSSCFISINNNDLLAPSNATDKDFSVRDFTRLSMGSAYKITVQEGSAFKVTATGDSKDIDDLKVVVKNEELQISYQNNRSRRYLMEINITMPTLRGVNFSGAATSTVRNFDVKDLDIDLSGASTINFDSKAQVISMKLSGASVANMTGTSQKVTADISGASDLNAFTNATEECALDLSGASRARVTVNKSLKVTASGASAVKYRGSPSVEKNTSGASTVEKD
jgi:Putative auto-transporter adhesin, head GIN domain